MPAIEDAVPCLEVQQQNPISRQLQFDPHAALIVRQMCTDSQVWPWGVPEPDGQPAAVFAKPSAHLGDQPAICGPEIMEDAAAITTKDAPHLKRFPNRCALNRPQPNHVLR